MDSSSKRNPQVLWSFWIGCGLAATGAIGPLLLAAGGTNRISGAVIPFGIAAIAMGADALMYKRGRPIATGLYFIAGLALVYGMLSMVAVPLRLAVLGTCDPLPAVCQAGFERPFTGGESSGFAFGIAMGTIAILVGFFGLLMLYRIRPQTAPPPPTRTLAWVAPSQAPAAQTEVAPTVTEAEPVPDAATVPAASLPEPAAAMSPPAAPPKPARKPRAKRVAKPHAELLAPASPLELPASESHLELPAPSSPEEPTSDEPASS